MTPAWIFHALGPERRSVTGFSVSSRPKPVTDRRSALSPLPAAHKTSGLVRLPKPLLWRFVLGGILVAFALPGAMEGVLLAQKTNAPAGDVMGTPSFGRVKNFYVPDYYDAPNQNQMKSLLRGAEAEPQPDGCVLIHDLQVETYRVDGTTDLTIRVPECLYDAVGQTASSACKFEACSGDGKLFIRGEGFRWQQTNSIFIISNRVHTTILGTPLTASKP